MLCATLFPNSRKALKNKRPYKGSFIKSGLPVLDTLSECRTDADKLDSSAVGDELSPEIFDADKDIIVTGQSKGKGFAGAVKRWNFRTQDASHGNSLSHRAPGSIGQCQTPGRVFKGKKMAGRLGAVRSTVKGQKIVSFYGVENQEEKAWIVLVKGGVPGASETPILISQFQD